ncbi:MAG: aminopeptidase P family protein [Pseudonocardiales bacterium]|nr:aminopeptidase P family protein [Pseudonocardiales bacterium]MBV9729310.1 aminopeptidase P family protein [Pseudonocardiales bacterium]
MAAPRNMLTSRLARAQQATRIAALDVLLVTPGPDLRYLLGVAGGSYERLTCLVLPADGDPVLVVPTLERPRLDTTPVPGLGLEIAEWADGDDPYALVADLLHRSRSAPARAAVGDAMPAAHVLALRAALPACEQELASTVLRQLRMRKDSAEIAALAAAGQAIDRVHARMGEWLRVGRTEAQVGADVAAAIVAEGHTAAAFVTVGAGPHGASPHHDVSDRVIQPGDVVVVDIGGPTPEGYFSDCTRTYSLGEPAEADVITCYAVLHAAQDAAVAAVAPGMTAEQVDAAARIPITDAGLGELFIHRTGHGIGLEVHEEPYIVTGNDLVLEVGMAFSIEPGIYLSGRWGARIEDIVVVNDSGATRLNHRPRELAVLPV